MRKFLLLTTKTGLRLSISKYLYFREDFDASLATNPSTFTAQKKRIRAEDFAFGGHRALTEVLAACSFSGCELQGLYLEWASEMDMPCM